MSRRGVDRGKIIWVEEIYCLSGRDKSEWRLSGKEKSPAGLGGREKQRE